ncbi:MAG: SAM-dependent methyltransferase, partial [Betaproteobacteria bacterium]|nr:SAM-dependent methyltransferase [Betaproteobacteria bacterium]
MVPNTLGGEIPTSIPSGNTAVIERLKYWIAEDPKSGRAFLKRVGTALPLQSIRIERLDKNTPQSSLPVLLAPILAGEDAGLLSEAGCPAVADPGSALIRLAHANAVRVHPLVGPSSLILALMASGLEGQRFSFHGYLPVAEAALEAKLRLLELESRKNC